MLVMVFQYLIVPVLKVFKIDLKSDFTVTRIKLCSKNRSFDTKRAKEDFGYIPRVHFINLLSNNYLLIISRYQ